MRPTELLNIQMQSKNNPVHQRRYTTLMGAIESAISGKVISVTALGRSWAGDVKEKHRIKRADTLMGNYRLFNDRDYFYRHMSQWLCQKAHRPVIQVDWSTLTSDEKWHLLRASISFHGRALTLYEMVFPQREYGKPQSHQRFLQRLRSVLPENCSPILVTDAGFKNPWFRAVSSMGWDWVGRIRGNVQVTRPGESVWMTATMFHYLIEPETAYEIGTCLLAKSSPLQCRLVSIKKTPKGRKDLNKKGKTVRGSKSRAHAKSQREPWLLATSLTDETVLQLINIYKQRMQIEEGFRDLKSPRLGLGMDYSGSRSLHRLSNLLLVASLALFALLLVGLTA